MTIQTAPYLPLPYLELLAKHYPTIQATTAKIIDLSARLHLPKGTEHFMSDIHGEYQAFSHLLRSGSGSIKRKIDETFGLELTQAEKQELATLIYYPPQKLSLVLKVQPQVEEWLRVTLFRLIRLCRAAASKYTRADLRLALPSEFINAIEELLSEQGSLENRLDYYETILETIIATGSAEAFICALAELIQRLEIAHLHILGDIFDRSPGAHRILDDLVQYHSVDVQWGNHDILWMGAAAGSEACIANVIRISMRYGNLETLEKGYSISLLPLASFATHAYRDDPCTLFELHSGGDERYSNNELRLLAQMHKAITIIQLKLEGQAIQRRPEYLMQDRLLLDKIDFQQHTVNLNGSSYPLLDTRFPTIDPANPYALTGEEQSVVDGLKLSFQHSEKLQRHVRFLLSKGSMYCIYNGNLLYHGCIPMNPDGSFYAPKDAAGQEYAVRAYLDHLDQLVRRGYLAEEAENRLAGQDTMWYLWSGAQSPLFGKEKMASFERYFIADRATHEEKKNPYYSYRDEPETARRILAEFGLEVDKAHIINGHVPVKVKKGESPVKAGGRLLVIDGGFARAYQKETGIAGYTLIYNSYGLMLAEHAAFESPQAAIAENKGINSQTTYLETNTRRIRIRDTDQGMQIRQKIEELHALLEAYRAGLVKEDLAGNY